MHLGAPAYHVLLCVLPVRSTIWDDNMFYPLNKRPDQKADAAGKATKAQRDIQRDILDTSHHAAVAPTKYGDDDDAPERDSYEPPHNYRKAAERPYDGGYGRGGDYFRREWPDCWGQCDAGKCTLQATYPGCCYLASSASGTNYGYRAYAAQQAPRTDDDKALAQPTYGRNGGSSDANGLVCWTDGQPYGARA